MAFLQSANYSRDQMANARLIINSESIGRKWTERKLQQEGSDSGRECSVIPSLGLKRYCGQKENSLKVLNK